MIGHPRKAEAPQIRRGRQVHLAAPRHYRAQSSSASRLIAEVPKVDIISLFSSGPFVPTLSQFTMLRRDTSPTTVRFLDDRSHRPDVV